MRDPCLSDANFIVNATPVGMSGDQLPIELDTIRPDALVLDLVYAPAETAFVREARARGHKATDGLRMLLHQGVAAFELWFQRSPDTDVMWSALLQAAGRTG
jgi:shikimate dehydrogenase